MPVRLVNQQTDPKVIEFADAPSAVKGAPPPEVHSIALGSALDARAEGDILPPSVEIDDATWAKVKDKPAVKGWLEQGAILAIPVTAAA
jgi:hypothetical protein